jgi:glycosyltransferase involved in cell wall biosynthesis
VLEVEPAWALFVEKMRKEKKYHRIGMIGQKSILSRQGGVEVVVRKLADGLAEDGFCVTCYDRANKEKKQTLNKNIKIRKVWTINAKGLAALSSSFFASILALFSRNDVIHYHAEGPCFWIWIVKFFSRKRIVVTIHGLDWQRAKWNKIASAVIKKGEKNAAKYADEIIVLSKNTKKYFKDTYNRETIYLPNGVDSTKAIEANVIKEKHGLNRDGYVLFLGRLVPEKGIHYLIDAYKQLSTDKKLVIAGGSSDSQEYANSLKDKVSKNVIFTGAVDGEELRELFSNAYIYVLPSDLEGMPISLLEAMSYGKCCLTSDIPECKEINYGNGFIFEKSNIESLRKKLAKLLDSPELVEKAGVNAKLYVEKNHDWSAIIKKTESIYKGQYGDQ